MSSRKNKNKASEASSPENQNEEETRIRNKSQEKSMRSEQLLPKTHISWKRIIIRILLCVGMLLAVYWNSYKNSVKIFATQKETVPHRTHEVPCSKDYEKESLKFRGCSPHLCGRFVTDTVISPQETAQLLQIARKGLAFGGSNGGASILDLHSGALSHGDSFINIYKKLRSVGKEDAFTERDFEIYRSVKNKIHQMIAFKFGVDSSKLFLTHPTFFSQMTSRTAKTVHDEYWHVHIDKETYPSFFYTSLLYLTDYDVDFNGGRFVFVDKDFNITVEPKIGRVSAFTSGSENPHYVEKVTGGIRYALTISFTCDKDYAIEDPSLKHLMSGVGNN